MRGQSMPIDGRYAEAIILMLAMGWSYADLVALEDAPVDFVDELIEHVKADAHWRQTRRRHEESMRNH